MIYLAIAAAVLAAASTAYSAHTSQQQAKYQAKVFHQQAESEAQAASARERDFRRRQSALMALRRSRQGASGTVVGEGTSLLTAADFARETELQAQRIRHGGEVISTRLDQQADITRYAGTHQARAGYIRAGSQLLGGASKAYGY